MSSSIDVEPACLSHASKSSCCQLLRSIRLPDPIPSLQPHYGLSWLLRIGPPQCSASVLWPRGFPRLGFSLSIRTTGSCSSAQQPASASRPLYAGRRPHRHQAPCGLDSQANHTHLVLTTFEFLTTRLQGFTCVRLSNAYLHELFSRFCSNAHDHGLLPQPLGVVWDLLLQADSKGPSLICHAAYPHGYLVHVELLLRVLLQHTMVKKFIRDLESRYPAAI
jgi:hypothetical protein